MPIQCIQIPAGTVLAGYRIESELGRGNNGVVYLARQESLDREVAFKVLLPELAAEPGYVTSFLREARLAARLDHQNIVQAYDAGPTPEGYYYFAMELVIGPSLEEIRRNFPETLTFDLIFRLSVELADALEYAWSVHHMTHGDIKPGNLLISRETGRLKLADLGLARVSGSRNSDDIMATPLYAAPEVIRGEKKEFGVKSDLYSFGIMLYELLCGTPPFIGNPEKVLEQHLYSTPQPLLTRNPDLDPQLAAFVERLMEKDPEKRPESWREVRDFFSARLNTPPDDSNAAIRAIISSEKKRRSLRVIGVWLIFLLILAILGAVVFLVFRLQQLEPEPIPPAPPEPAVSVRERDAVSIPLPESKNSSGLSERPASEPVQPEAETGRSNEKEADGEPRERRAQTQSRSGGRGHARFSRLFDPPVNEEILLSESRRVRRLFQALGTQFPDAWREQAFLVTDESLRLTLQLHQLGMAVKRVDRIELEPNGDGRIRWISNGPVSGTLRLSPNTPPLWIAGALGEGLFEANNRRLALPQKFRTEFGGAFLYFVEQRLMGKGTSDPSNRILAYCNHSLPVFVQMLQNRNMLEQLKNRSR